MPETPTLMMNAGNGDDKSAYPVKLNPKTAEEINAIAAVQRVDVEVLINNILSDFVRNQPPAEKNSGAEFLLSLAGMFSSGVENTSEDVATVIRESVLNKYPSKNHDRSS